MEQIQNILKQREQYLLGLIEQKEKNLSRAPAGHLRISVSNNRVQYYQKGQSEKNGGKYLREKERDLARQLAQKDYDKKIIHAARHELCVIERYKETYSENFPEKIFGMLHQERQKLIDPIVEPEEEFVRNWEEVEYKGLGFSDETPEYYSMKGERVRSKSEVIIADMLYKNGIPYRYEYPLYVKGYGMFYPDFTVLNIRKRKEIRYEHFGRMDDPVYAEKAVQKLHTYNQNGFFLGDKLMATFETWKNPVSQKEIQNLINTYLK